jgi:uncharacterized repeat protein (TIGR03803 family)
MATLSTLFTFNVLDGAAATGGFIADANGDLFGTTTLGGVNGFGTVFEVQNNGTATAPSYASAPTTLVNFSNNDPNGDEPEGALISDADGDLFGTTSAGGAYGEGTVFELAKTSTGYASAPTTLISFNSLNGSEGAIPMGSLMIDANGDLFGTTTGGGAYGDGTVFELQNIGTTIAPSYASAPTTLVSFDGSDGGDPQSGLIADANGDLLGATSSTVFEVTGRDPSPARPPPNFFSSVEQAGILWRNANGDTELWNPSGSGGFTYQNLGVVNTSWQIAGTGSFNGATEAGILWRNANGDTELWNANGSGGYTYENLGVVSTSWQIAGTGDFGGSGETGILWRNTNGDVELWNSNGSGGFTYENLGIVNTSWQIVAAGNVNGDGNGSILWQNSDGDTELWSGNGTGSFTYQELTSFGIGGTGGGQIAGFGDIDSPGDILTRAQNGDATLWSPLFPGYEESDLGPLSNSLQIVGTGDFSGSSDSILLRNANGDTELGSTNGGSGSLTYQDLGVVSTAWSVQKIFA